MELWKWDDEIVKLIFKIQISTISLSQLGTYQFCHKSVADKSVIDN
jgi:hypothetical protein